MCVSMGVPVIYVHFQGLCVCLCGHARMPVHTF